MEARTCCSVLLISLALACLPVAAEAQESIRVKDRMTAVLPVECRVIQPGHSPSIPRAKPLQSIGRSDEAHVALAEPIEPMLAKVADGLARKDTDVAFICAMIALDQGAIDLAKVDLQYGSEHSWTTEFAHKLIIDVDTRDIAKMTEWLKSGGRKEPEGKP